MSKYKLVRHSVVNLQVLEDEVNELIEQGWAPVGSVIQTTIDGTIVFVQQMKFVQAIDTATMYDT
jgi:hypothetical protein